MRSRCELMPKHLPEFAQFCESRGWKPENTKGPYEVLRMRHPDIREPMMVHRRDVSEVHLTVWGQSERLTNKFFAARRQQKLDTHNQKKETT